ncbi:MAG: hypothetical protein JNJ54_04635 [Myxococcaceae bacterium]|nr:hypothetical protein [Myxococcaceae bacterium]
MKKVNLGFELAEVRSTAEGVRVLSDLLANGNAPDEVTERALPSRISAALSLIIERLRLCERVANDSMNPLMICAEHNAPVDRTGLCVSEWDRNRIQQEREQEKRRLGFEARRGRPRRRS